MREIAASTLAVISRGELDMSANLILILMSSSLVPVSSVISNASSDKAFSKEIQRPQRESDRSTISKQLDELRTEPSKKLLFVRKHHR